jgi:hypothetical protein
LNNPFDAKNLSDTFITDEITDRLLTCSLADLAVDLARQAGEEVRRPLSLDQLARAVHANTEERQAIWRLLETRWAEMHRDGDLNAPFRVEQSRKTARG